MSFATHVVPFTKSGGLSERRMSKWVTEPPGGIGGVHVSSMTPELRLSCRLFVSLGVAQTVPLLSSQSFAQTATPSESASASEGGSAGQMGSLQLLFLLSQS